MSLIIIQICHTKDSISHIQFSSVSLWGVSHFMCQCLGYQEHSTGPDSDKYNLKCLLFKDTEVALIWIKDEDDH